MPRRRRTSLFEDLFQFASILPWWIGIGLAVIFFLALHYLSIGEVPRATDASAIGSAMGFMVLKTFALTGKFLFPAIFIFGAVASVVSKFKSKTPTIIEPRAQEAPEWSGSGSLSLARDSDVMDRYQPTGERKPPERRAPGWTVELLNAIDWKRFEEVCAEYFRICGFESDTQPRGPDGGIDIRLFAKNDRSTVENIVQCKQRRRRTIGPKPLRELLGVMTAEGIPRGIFVTSSHFNDEARRFARGNRIYLIDGEQLVEKIVARSDTDKQRLMNVATEGDYLTPSCPSCGTKLVKRKNRKDNSEFWGCRSYPACRYTLNTAGS